MRRDRAAIFLLGGVTATFLGMAVRDPDPIHSVGSLVGFLICAVSGIFLILE